MEVVEDRDWEHDAKRTREKTCNAQEFKGQWAARVGLTDWCTRQPTNIDLQGRSNKRCQDVDLRSGDQVLLSNEFNSIRALQDLLTGIYYLQTTWNHETIESPAPGSQGLS